MTTKEGARKAASGERQGGRPVIGMLLGDSSVLSINIYRTAILYQALCWVLLIQEKQVTKS